MLFLDEARSANPRAGKMNPSAADRVTVNSGMTNIETTVFYGRFVTLSTGQLLSWDLFHRERIYTNLMHCQTILLIQGK